MPPKNLSQLQVSGLVGLGVVYWGIAAYKIRYAGHIVYAHDLRRYPKERLASTVIMCSPALVLDGIAFMWFPTIYENPTLKQNNPFSAVVLSRMGAAWILYGVGAILGMALLT